MAIATRRIGLEQEFFLVDDLGDLSHRADDFLAQCRAMASDWGCDAKYFVPEFVKSTVEINTPPAYTVAELAGSYLKHLDLALRAAREIGVRLYPLASYPLPVEPVMRDRPNCHAQARTLGYDRAQHSGRCTGTHLHLEAPPGSIDARIGVSYDTTPGDRAELLNLYNLATALDAAMIALSRSCPFYQGQLSQQSSHIVRYRGSQVFDWEGVFTRVQCAGGLRPYANSIETLVELQFSRHYDWLKAMDAAKVDRALFLETGGSLLESAWNPIRLNAIGTVEIRCVDSNYPAIVIALMSLVNSVSQYVRRNGLTVKSVIGQTRFEQQGLDLLVPDFDYLNGPLLYAAVTAGIKHPDVNDYLHSILEFARPVNREDTDYLATLHTILTTHRTTEADILQQFQVVPSELSRESGLSLVRQCCDRLEQEVLSLYQKHLSEAANAVMQETVSYV
ncbi:MAG TPA: glutamate-cysteine ligase family protein [Crinalium sp.]